MNNIRLIASDMDGTLLNRQGVISPGNLSAIRMAQKAGVVFAICTGRYPENVSIMLNDIGLECPVISLNGSVIEINGKRAYAYYMPQDVNKAVHAALERAGASYYMFCDRVVVTRREGIRHHSETQYGERLAKQYGVTYAYGEKAARAAADGKLFKYYVYEDDESCSMEEARQTLADVPGIAVTASSGRNFEIMPEGSNKARGLEVLANMLHIPRESVMALGDYDNDIEMLEYAGLGVAMDNATDRVKRVADAVTGDHDKDGVAEAIMRFLPASGAGRDR